MNEIEIFETELGNDCKIAILRGGLHSDNPTAIMNEAVATYVGNKGYNEFVEVFLDNPWVRIVVGGINTLVFEEFKDQRL